jgi:peroxiredoxin/mono/diheme cytochrome c family protein
MKAKYLLLSLFAVQFATTPSFAADDKPVADFMLKDIAGKEWSLYKQKNKATVIVFLSCECPMSNAYVKPIGDLVAKYKDKGVAVIGINANKEESTTQIAAHAKEFGITIPILKDDDLVAAKLLGVKVNPEAVVLDDKFVVRYRGRIDDGYTERMRPAPKTTRFDVTAALDELLVGKPVSVAYAQAFGCPLPLEPKKPSAAATVNYYRDVAPILQKNCQSCHRPGEVGPFVLETYKQAVKWADNIVSETESRRMPPWKPQPADHIRGQRSLSEKEIKTLSTWVEQGMSEGDKNDAPPPIKFPEGWQLGTPDVVLEMPTEAVVAATGRDLFHCVVFPTNFGEDKYLAAIEVRPGNARVVHHTVQVIDTEGRGRKLQDKAQKAQKPTDADRGPGYSVRTGMGFLPNPANALGGWAPGLVPQRLPAGVGQKLPKDSDIVVQIHYHRTGKEERDKTRLGLYFARGPVKEYLQAIPVTGLFFSIPANESAFKVNSTITIMEDVKLHWMVPHMHLLGKDIELLAKLPGQEEKSLIKITAWDYNWQEQYMLKEPMVLPKDTLLRVKATFDNSDKNPLNPFSPPQRVRIGEQTTNEMCFVFCGVSSPDPGFWKFRINLGKQ